jgi:hypothetical protein
MRKNHYYPCLPPNEYKRLIRARRASKADEFTCRTPKIITLLCYLSVEILYYLLSNFYRRMHCAPCPIDNRVLPNMSSLAGNKAQEPLTSLRRAQDASLEEELWPVSVETPATTDQSGLMSKQYNHPYRYQTHILPSLQ